MYSFILFKFKDNELVNCDYLTSKEITANNYNFDEDYMSLDDFSTLLRPLIKNSSLYISKLNNNKSDLYRIYGDLLNKEYQKVSIEDKESKSIKVFKIPNYELESIKNKKKETHSKISKIQKKGKINRINLFNQKQVVITSLSTILLLSSNIVNAKIKNNYEKLAKENIIETQEEVMNTIEINNLIEDIKHFSDTLDIDSLKIQTDDWTNTQKCISCYENYYDKIEKYAKMYGIDPSVAFAIACHERGSHSNQVDAGGGIGLYQIQIEGSWNWDNKEVSAYNFDTNSIETFKITKDNVSNLDNNIKVGLMIFQNCLQRNDYNIAKAITEYNYGSTFLDKTINDACYFLDKDDSYFNDINHLEWLNYRNYGGDPHYLENVMKYIDNNKVLSFTTQNGEEKKVRFNNLNNELEVASNNIKR